MVVALWPEGLFDCGGAVSGMQGGLQEAGPERQDQAYFGSGNFRKVAVP